MSLEVANSILNYKSLKFHFNLIIYSFSESDCLDGWKQIHSLEMDWYFDSCDLSLNERSLTNQLISGNASHGGRKTDKCLSFE